MQLGKYKKRYIERLKQSCPHPDDLGGILHSITGQQDVTFPPLPGFRELKLTKGIRTEIAPSGRGQ